jgi:hypothetical protein
MSLYKTGLTLLAASIIGATTLTIGANATPELDEPAQVAVNSGEITYSGKLLFRIRTGAGGYTPEQRAEQVKERLVPILSLAELRAEDIRVVQTAPKQDASLYVRDHLLITVDRNMALANGNGDPADLARVWAERVRQILPQVVTTEDSPFLDAPGDAR